MARTSKKTKAVPVADTAADLDVRSVGETEAVAAVESGAETASVAASGETVFIPLNKLKKSLRNERKTPHSEADISGVGRADGGVDWSFGRKRGLGL